MLMWRLKAICWSWSSTCIIWVLVSDLLTLPTEPSLHSFFLVFWDKIALYSAGWPWNHDSSRPAFTTPGGILLLCRLVTSSLRAPVPELMYFLSSIFEDTVLQAHAKCPLLTLSLLLTQFPTSIMRCSVFQTETMWDSEPGQNLSLTNHIALLCPALFKFRSNISKHTNVESFTKYILHVFEKCFFP